MSTSSVEARRLDDIDGRLYSVFANVFGVQRAAWSPSLSPATLPRWDSVGHLTLMMSIEDEFGIVFSDIEVQTLTSVEALRSHIATRTTP